MGTTKSGRVRERLPRTISEDHKAKLKKGLREAQARAPKKPNGKIVSNYKFRTLVDEPTIIGPVSKTYGGVVSEHKPAFLRYPALRKRMIKYIRLGYPYTTVCNYCGVKSAQFLVWLEKGKNGYNEEYVRFYKDVCKAEAKGEMEILKKLRKHSSADWRVSAWQLERMWPEKFGRVDRIRAETRATISVTTDAKKNLGTKVTNDEVARELARRMIDGDEKVGFNALPAPERSDAR